MHFLQTNSTGETAEQQILTYGALWFNLLNRFHLSFGEYHLFMPTLAHFQHKTTIQKMHFNKRYFFLTIVLFIIEVLIALYVRDAIIRPYGGDFLVVILLYFFVKTFWNISPLKAAIGVLLFSYLVEILQYFKIVNILGLQGNRMAEIIIGTGFSWWDMLAYTLGAITIYWLDR